MIYRAGKAAGRVLFWQGEVKGSQYRSLSGTMGGVTKTSAWSDAGVMNAGRSNEMSAEEQAIFCIEAKMAKSLKSGGYFTDIKKIGTAQFVAPMLAHKYETGVTKLDFPLLVQNKLNGVRCQITQKGMFTRNGEEIVTCPHIFDAVKWVFEKLGATLVLDGELYNHDLYEDLNDLVSLVRKKTPSVERLAQAREIVQFHMYDCVHLGGELEAQDFRLKRIPTIVGLSRSPSIVAVATRPARNMAEVEKLYHAALADHYEGVMLRWANAPYLRDRSNKLLKYKPRYDDEFTILLVEDGNGKRKNMAAKIWCKTKEGVEFKANVKWSDARKTDIWAMRHKLIGKKATVSYAYITAYGKPFHGYVEAIWESGKKI